MMLAAPSLVALLRGRLAPGRRGVGAESPGPEEPGND